jgi:hypothetical protein
MKRKKRLLLFLGLFIMICGGFFTGFAEEIPVTCYNGQAHGVRGYIMTWQCIIGETQYDFDCCVVDNEETTTCILQKQCNPLPDIE